MIRAIAIDDEPLALEIIEAFCEPIEGLQLVRKFTKTSEARTYLEMHSVDLLLLDIHMPAISGIEFYKHLKAETPVIFTTAHSEYAIEGFNLSAIDYLLKPYDFERFSLAMSKAKDYLEYLKRKQSKAEKDIYIKADYSVIKVSAENILMIEGLADYLKIHLKEGKPIVARMTLKSILEILPTDFIRVHRSFIVSIKQIDAVRNKTIQVKNHQIPIGATYKNDFDKAFQAK